MTPPGDLAASLIIAGLVNLRGLLRTLLYTTDIYLAACKITAKSVFFERLKSFFTADLTHLCLVKGNTRCKSKNPKNHK